MADARYFRASSSGACLWHAAARTCRVRQFWLSFGQMRHEIVLAPDAAKAFDALPAHRRAELRDALERHLRHEPARVSKSRIKRLRGLSRPQYRLRVGEVRVFYDVTADTVEILAIVTKGQAARWLAAYGTPNAPGGAG